MATNSYPAGSTVSVSVQFNNSGVAADPTTVTLYTKGPGIGLATYVYGSSAIAKSGTGAYNFPFTTTVSGAYYYRWLGNFAAGNAAGENTFIAGPSNFV